jgi:hypothetical protein
MLKKGNIQEISSNEWLFDPMMYVHIFGGDAVIPTGVFLRVAGSFFSGLVYGLLELERPN